MASRITGTFSLRSHDATRAWWIASVTVDGLLVLERPVGVPHPHVPFTETDVVALFDGIPFTWPDAYQIDVRQDDAPALKPVTVRPDVIITAHGVATKDGALFVTLFYNGTEQFTVKLANTRGPVTQAMAMALLDGKPYRAPDRSQWGGVV